MSVPPVELAHQTGDARVDSIVRDLIARFEAAFPAGVRSCYLVGSRAEGSGATVSDIDGFLLLAGELAGTERRRADELLAACARASPVRLDFEVHGESDAALVGSPDVRLKLGGRLVYGEDVRAAWPLPSLDAYQCYITDWPPLFLRVLHDQARLRYPLSHPEPDGELFGYERKRAPAWYPPEVTQGTKEFVATICWTATARIALDAGAFVASRAECVRLYRERVGDEWSELVEDAYRLCKLDWDYRVPEDREARAQLRALGARALPFFNDYLRRYLRYLLESLAEPETARDLLARLPDALYPERDLDAALERLTTARDPGVAESAREAHGRLQRWRAEATDAGERDGAGDG